MPYHVVCSVRDAKAEAFGQPFFAQQNGIAIRSFADECGNPESQLNRHPEDFVLFQIGEFDDLTGVISPLQQPVAIARALDYKTTA